MNLKDKRFLITHSIIQGLMGSTVVALELADYLQGQGAKVTLYTSYYGEPAIHFFNEKNITVVGRVEEPELHLEDFDYIWVQSQVLPFSIVTQLGEKLPAKMPVFIFNHMSALEEVSDEHPYIHGLEEALSSLSLFVSPETQKHQLPFFTKKLNFGLYRNPAPVSFSKLNYMPKTKLHTILIVSNHPPEELFEAKKLLQEKGYKVVSLGEGQEKDTLVTPEVLGEYDLVITIGKTVQFCLTAGIPVYVYDHFGGNGYIDEQHYKATAERNFSGRDGQKKSASELVNDIVSRYDAAVKYQTENRKQFIDELSINAILPAVLAAVKPREVEQFSVSFAKTMLSAQRFGNRFYKYWGWLRDVERYRDELRHEVYTLEERNKEIQKTVESLRREREALEVKMEKIIQSKSYKLGRSVAVPVVGVKRVARRFMKKK